MVLTVTKMMMVVGSKTTAVAEIFWQKEREKTRKYLAKAWYTTNKAPCTHNLFEWEALNVILLTYCLMYVVRQRIHYRNESMPIQKGRQVPQKIIYLCSQSGAFCSVIHFPNFFFVVALPLFCVSRIWLFIFLCVAQVALLTLLSGATCKCRDLTNLWY